MRVYDPLMKYLDECGLQTVTLTYSEIEKNHRPRIARHSL